MGQELSLSKAVFAVPPASYDEASLEGLLWIPPDPSTPHPAEQKGIPGVLLEWKGPQDESAFFTLLYCNDGSRDLGLTLPWLKTLRDTLHANVMAFDYTGYGLHEGTPSESACYENVRSVSAWLTTTKGVQHDRLIIVGKSIGSGVAIDLVSATGIKTIPPRRHFGSRLIPRGKSERSSSVDGPQLGSSGSEISMSRFAGLVLLSPFPSVLSLDSMHKMHLSGPDLFDSTRKLKHITCPVLMARGENDHIVLKSQVKKIFKKLNHPWKCLHLEGVGHHDVETSHDYLDGLVEFVDYLMPKGTTIKSEIVVPKFFTETPNQVVANILGHDGMEQYTNLFISQGYMDPFIISTLEEIDIIGMGITDPEHVEAICRAIDHVRQSNLDSLQTIKIFESSVMFKSDDAFDHDVGKEETKSNEKRRKKTSLPPMKQVEAFLKPFLVKFDDLPRGKLLKTGFFEEVYLSEWKDQKVVARKLLSKSYQYEQFARHAATILSFKHPNLLLPLAVSIEESNVCLVTPWMQRGSLYDALQQEGVSFTPLERVHIALGVAEGLLYLHSQSPAPFLHNDMSSRNVILDDSSSPRLNNFGLSRPSSFLWMAPEVFTKKKYSTAADVFSLGVVLWEILTGHHPFEGVPPSVAVLRVSKDGHRPPLPSTKRKAPDEEVVEAWTSLISNCWHSDPSRRPSTKSVVERVRKLFNSIASLSPPPLVFSFASSFAPYPKRENKTRRGSSPTPQSAPTLLRENNLTSTPPTKHQASLPVPSNTEGVQSIMVNMQGLLDRVKNLQQSFDSIAAEAEATIDSLTISSSSDRVNSEKSC